MSSPSKSNSDPEHQTNELEAARNLLRATLDASTDMIQVFEAVRDDQGAITDFIWKLNNHASEKIYGDVVGKRLLQLQPGVVEEGIFDAFKRVVETGEAQQYEKHYVHEQFDGWFHQSVVKLNDGVTATTADITSRKNAEAEIIRLKDEIAQKTEDKYRSIFNAIEEGYCLVEVILNDDGKPVDEVFLEMNPAYEKHTGLTKDILGKRTSQIVPNREPEWAEFFGNVAISGEPAFIEYHLNEIDRWLSAHASRVGGAGSLKVAIVFQDITERKRREMRLAFLAEVTNVFANLSNPDEIMQTVGEKLGAYLQITTVNFTDVNEAEDKVRVHYGWSDASVPSTVDTFRLSQYLDEGFVRTSHAGETVVIRDTQTDPRTDAAGYAALSMYSFVTVPFHNQGKWTHYIAVCHSQVRDWRKDEVELIEEISNRIFPRLEKARAEEALRESEEKFRTLFHSIDEGFLIHEMIRDESGQAIDFRLMEVNPAFTRQTGLGREMIGKLNSEYAPKTEKFWLETFDRVAHTGTPESVENYHQDTDRWYRVHVSKVGGQDSRIAAVFEDITERKQRERQQEFLLKFSDALRSEQGAHAVANRALEMLVEELRLDRSYITTYYLDEDRARLDYQIGNDTVLPLPEYFVLSDYPEAFKSTFDKTLVIDDELERQGLSEAERRNSGNLGMRAMVAATLHKENKPLWSMVAINSRPRSWTAGEIALVEAVAERTWAAIEHAKSEETLRHADERYRAMTDNVPVLIWETDESGLISCNRHYTDFFGVSFEEVRGMGWAKSLHPDDVEAYTAAYRKAFERGESYSYECRLRRADGEYRWLLTTGHPLNENRFVGFCADITEKKRAEEALRESEEKFRTLFNSIDEGFAIQEVVTDKNGNVTDVIWRESNRAFENLSGMKDVVGKKASEYLPNLEQNWLNALTQVFKTGEPLRNEDFTADLNRWIAYQYSRIGEAGSPLIGVVFDDITERKRRELNTALLDEIGKDLSILSAPDEIMQAVGARLGRCLNLGVVVFVDVDEARGEAVVHHGWDKEGELNLRNQTYRLVDYLTEDFMRDMRAGEISVVRDPATDKRVSGDAYAAVNVGAWVSVPFHRNGQWKAFITMTDVAPRNWRADEIALVRNIAERVFPRIERARAEEALLESKKRFQSIANLVPDLLWDSEPDGATNWYNDRWLEYTGQTLEEAIGWGWTDAIHPDDREGSAMRYNQAVEAGKLLRQEHRITSSRWPVPLVCCQCIALTR
ncbi:PAS domain S-box protein [Dyadobacter bucti]|uniref:PAS domain S-box protein n=1 Tax=Dyadobacter bucti TaxID=2572203 RepID=UPI0011094EC5|nr:PAS domain S-box protein [Dyadobacter bucti]